MGFFDKLFGGKHDAAPKFAGEKMTVMAPIDGTVIPLEQLPDETFAAAILGPGCGIEPTGDTVYAPFDGTITQVASTLHAIGITSDDGIELLIHVGMDTVEMQGKGFTALVKEEQKVKAGTALLKVDLDAIRAANHPTDSTRELVNAARLKQMKPNAILINTGRGPLVNEQDLADALNNGTIFAAGLDVLSQEPPRADNPLLTARNCYITPHIAWASAAARERLMQIMLDNIKAFLDEKPINSVIK